MTKEQLAKEYVESKGIWPNMIGYETAISDFLAGYNAKPGAVWVKAEKDKMVEGKNYFLKITIPGTNEIIEATGILFLDKYGWKMATFYMEEGPRIYYLESCEYLDETQPAYSRAEVKELLRQQRELCLKSFQAIPEVVTDTSEAILNAPSPVNNPK